MKSDNLFQLIRSLSKHEKKFFRQFSGMRGGQKKYLLLFDALASMKVYNEDKLRALLAGEKFLHQLPVAKNYLNSLILKSLRLFHSSSTTEVLLSEELRNVEILYSRGLFAQAAVVLKRASALATENEKHLRHIELLQWKRKLVRISGYAGFDEKQMSREREERNSLFEKLINSTGYEELSDEFFLMASSTNHLTEGKRKKAFLKISSDPYLTDMKKAKTYKSKYVFNQINARIHHVSGNAEKASSFSKRQIELIEALPEKLFTEERYNYIIALYNQLILLNELMKENEFRETLSKLKALPVANEKEGLAVFYSVVTECDFLLRTHNFSGIDTLEKKIVAGLEKYAGKVNVQIELGLYYSLAALFLQSAQARKAAKWLNRIFQNQKHQVRQDIYCMAHLLQLLVHVELKHFDLLSRMALSAERFLRSREAFGEMEEFLLNYFGRLIPQASSVRERKQLYSGLKEELLLIQKKQVSARVFSMFDFTFWLNRMEM